MRIAIYPGSFDPVTLGHLDLIQRAKDFADKLIVAILQNPTKRYTFSSTERANFLTEVLAQEPNIEVAVFQGLLVDFAKQKKAQFIVRGVRVFSDFEYEFQMALINRKLEPNLETMFLMPRGDYSIISSSMVREIGMMGGSIVNLVPKILVPRITERLTMIPQPVVI